MTSLHDEYVDKDGKCKLCGNFYGNSGVEFSLHFVLHELRKIRKLLDNSNGVQCSCVCEPERGFPQV